MRMLRVLTVIALSLFAPPALAADYPAPKDGEWVAHDFKFHTGETLAELKLHYMTIGDPAGIPVIVLHGTALSAASVLAPALGGRTFWPWSSARRLEIFHRHPRGDRPWEKLQAVRWSQDQIPTI